MKKFLRQTDGVAMIEYSLIVALVALSIVGAVTYLGQETGELHEHNAVEFSTAIDQSLPGGG